MRSDASLGAPSQTILIVDDTPANFGVPGDCLEGRGFRVGVQELSAK